MAYGLDTQARLPEATARTAAEGWGGDSYSVFYNDATGDVVLAAHWVWDTTALGDVNCVRPLQQRLHIQQSRSRGRSEVSDVAQPPAC